MKSTLYNNCLLSPLPALIFMGERKCGKIKLYKDLKVVKQFVHLFIMIHPIASSRFYSHTFHRVIYIFHINCIDNHT